MLLRFIKSNLIVICCITVICCLCGIATWVIFSVENPDTRFEQARRIIWILIKSRNYQSKWTKEQVDKTVQEILITEQKIGEHFTKILATIELESRFRYWVRSKKNKDGTRDYGLTQQNEKYYQYRCGRVLKRSCRRHELFIPYISVKLMRWRFEECKRFSGIDLFMCYNSVDRVYRSSQYKNAWLTAYIKVLKIWKKVNYGE